MDVLAKEYDFEVTVCMGYSSLKQNQLGLT